MCKRGTKCEEKRSEGEAKCNFSVRRFFQRQGNHLCSSQRLLNSYHCRLYLLKNVYSISFTVTARYLPGRFCSNSSRAIADDGNWMTRDTTGGKRGKDVTEEEKEKVRRVSSHGICAGLYFSEASYIYYVCIHTLRDIERIREKKLDVLYNTIF